MRLYSSTPLSCFQVIQAFHTAHLNPRMWQNYYFYYISSIKPLIISTQSPLENLKNNNKYYCYDKYCRNNDLEIFGNIRESITILNKNMDYNTTSIYVPKIILPNDIIIIHKSLADLNRPMTSKYYYPNSFGM